jgi:hypothetical protein
VGPLYQQAGEGKEGYRFENGFLGRGLFLARARTVPRGPFYIIFLFLLFFFIFSELNLFQTEFGSSRNQISLENLK